MKRVLAGLLLLPLSCMTLTAEDTPAKRFENWLLGEFNAHVDRRTAASNRC